MAAERAVTLILLAAIAGCSSHSEIAATPVVDASLPPPSGADAGVDAAALHDADVDGVAIDASDASDASDAGDAAEDYGPPPGATPPATLEATGLYADIATHTIAPGLLAFAPRYTLWSDGAEKHRWVSLPAGAVIDTHDIDHWSFPVGTKFWKEFVVGGKRIETRLIERVGPRRDDYLYGAYAWNSDESAAVLLPEGRLDANGSGHDIPAQAQCVSCHGYLPEHILGFGAVMLDGAPNANGADAGASLTLASLAASGVLSAPPTSGMALEGDATTRDALGYLHANCSNCHNGSGISFPTPFSLRLAFGDTTLAGTAAYRTAVGVPVERFVHPGITQRIQRADADHSAVAYRMTARGTVEQMPPTATRVSDPTGIAKVRAWIGALAP